MEGYAYYAKGYLVPFVKEIAPCEHNSPRGEQQVALCLISSIEGEDSDLNHTSRRRTWERLAPCAVALALLSLAGCQGHKIIARVNDAIIATYVGVHQQ